MLVLVLGLALIILILIVMLVALQRKDIIEIIVDVKYPWRFTIKIKRDKPNKTK